MTEQTPGESASVDPDGEPTTVSKHREVPGDREPLYIHEPARQTPVLHQADVLIVGGGLAGVAAATATAQLGAETLLLERSHLLGGMASAAMPGGFGILADMTIDATGDGLLEPVSVNFVPADVDVEKARAYEEEMDDRCFGKAIAEAKHRGDITEYPHERFAVWRPMFGTGIAWFNATRVTQVDATRTEDISRAIAHRVNCRPGPNLR